MIIMREFSNRLCVVGLPSSDNKAEEATIDLTIGVSFDGTLNNKYNTKWASTESIDDSYRNAYTNVVKLWRYYNCNNKDSFKVYIEGPGTVSPLLISRTIRLQNSTRRSKNPLIRMKTALGYLLKRVIS